MAGFRLAPERSVEPADNGDLDAVAVIGSDLWATAEAPDVAPLLTSVAARGGLVAGICAGTLALARAGLFSGRAHTSNGRDWIDAHLPDYPGREFYRDVAQAVGDGPVVSAPGSAPGTFALAVLERLYADQSEQLAQMRELFAREYQPDGMPRPS
jgi:putative intracellular protease/amidase